MEPARLHPVEERWPTRHRCRAGLCPAGVTAVPRVQRICCLAHTLYGTSLFTLSIASLPAVAARPPDRMSDATLLTVFVRSAVPAWWAGSPAWCRYEAAARPVSSSPLRPAPQQRWWPGSCWSCWARAVSCPPHSMGPPPAPPHSMAPPPGPPPLHSPPLLIPPYQCGGWDNRVPSGEESPPRAPSVSKIKHSLIRLG